MHARWSPAPSAPSLPVSDSSPDLFPDGGPAPCVALIVFPFPSVF